MTPSFFGPSDCQLLGIHHPAQEPARRHGVVLCYPAPQEYMRAHWSFRRLAERLAAAGFDVLRFDYRGTGDSYGALPASTVGAWATDIAAAAEELKAITGVERLTLVGFRMGANTLAAALEQGLSCEHAVFWEPLWSGLDWMREIGRIENEMHRDLIHQPLVQTASLFGYELPPTLAQEWATIDFSRSVQASTKPWQCKRADVVCEEAGPTHARATAACSSAHGVPCQFIEAEGALSPVAGHAASVGSSIVQKLCEIVQSAA